VHDGVDVISNPAESLLDAHRSFVTELWAVQGPNWENPFLVHAEAGLITVVDPQANRIHMVSTSGEIGATIGRSGGGPGEFLHMQDAFPVGDRLAVFDRGKAGIEYLSLDGAYLSSLRVEGWVWGGFPLADGGLLVKGDFRTDPTESTSGTWIKVADGHDAIPFTPRPLEQLPEEQGVACSDLYAWAGRAARLRSTTPQIQVLDGTGRVVMESRIDLPIEVVSDAELELALSNLRRRLAGSGSPPEFQQQAVVVMEERWRVKCRFGPLRVDPSNGVAAMLEQNPDEFGSGNATLHFLSPGGVYLAKADFPRSWRDFTLADGVVYALTRDPTTDLITLRAYRLNLPGTLLTDTDEVLDAARRNVMGD
jgi:hypothetical protein